ncbi:MAG: hypothetical protein Q8Q67_01975 [bacterium]|nr:hypothetical protein [bacterium]
MKKNVTEIRPFHETIVEAINGSSECDFPTLFALVGITIIPKNHDAIIRAINKKRKELGLSRAVSVINHLRTQKEMAKEKYENPCKDEI